MQMKPKSAKRSGKKKKNGGKVRSVRSVTSLEIESPVKSQTIEERKAEPRPMTSVEPESPATPLIWNTGEPQKLQTIEPIVEEKPELTKRTEKKLKKEFGDDNGELFDEYVKALSHMKPEKS